MDRIVRFALVAVMGTACYPSSVKGTRNVSRVVGEPIVDDIGKLTIRTEVTDSLVKVNASWPRQCHRDVVDTVEETSGSEIKIVGGVGWGILWAPLLILAYPVGIADVVITGIAVIANPSKSDRVQHAGEPIQIACPFPAANVPIQLTLPSGKIVDAKTDVGGRYIYELAGVERGGAPVSVRVDTSQPKVEPTIATEPPKPPVELPATLTDREVLDGLNPVRDDVTACGPRLHVGGPISVRVSVSNSGRVASFQAGSASRELAACIGAALKAARFALSEEGAHAVVTFRFPGLEVAPADAVAAAPRVQTAAIEPRDPKTKELATKAFERARAGNCATAKAIGVAIRDSDLPYYTRVFLVEPSIAACMH